MKQIRRACLIRISSSSSTRSQLVDKESFSFGRSAEADVLSLSLGVSRSHLLARVRDGRLWVEDQGSANGTSIDGAPLPAKSEVELKAGAELRLGASPEVFQVEFIDIPMELAGLDQARVAIRAAAQEIVEQAKSEARNQAEFEVKATLENARAEARRLDEQSREAAKKLEATASEAARKIEEQAREAARAFEKEARLRIEEETLKIAAEKRAASSMAKVDAQREAELILKDAAAKSGEALDRAEEQAEARIRETQRKTAQIMEAAEAAAEKTLLDARAATSSIRSDAQREAEATRAKAVQKLLEATQKAEQEADEILTAARDKAHALVESEGAIVAKAVAEAKEAAIAESKTESLRLVEAGRDEGRRLVDEAKKEAAKAESKLRELERRIANVETESADALAKSKAAQDQAKHFEDERLKARALLEAIVAELSQAEARADVQLAELKKQAEIVEARLAGANAQAEEAAKALAASQAKTADLERERPAIAEQIEAAKREAKAIKDRELIKSTERRREEEAELATARVRLIEETKARLIEEEKQVQALRKMQAKQIEAQLEPLLVQRLTEVLKTAKAALLLDSVRDEIRKTTEQVLSGADETVTREIERSLAVDRAREQKGTARRKRAMAIWTAPAAAALAIGIFPTQAKKMWDAAFVEHSEMSLSSIAADILAEKRRKEKYVPQQTDEFGPTYVDNVVFTRGYVETMADARFQQKWTLALNRFFVEDLKLSENAMVEFVPAEAGLLHKLTALRDGIDDRRHDEGLANMRKTEQDERARLVSLVGGEVGFAKLRAFEKHQFEAFRIENAPRSSSAAALSPVSTADAP